jgi:hypothetical protein
MAISFRNVYGNETFLQGGDVAKTPGHYVTIATAGEQFKAFVPDPGGTLRDVLQIYIFDKETSNIKIRRHQM